jgi:hypothetical protein
MKPFTETRNDKTPLAFTDPGSHPATSWTGRRIPKRGGTIAPALICHKRAFSSEERGKVNLVGRVEYTE